jgi:hypothetical protein
MNEFEKQLEQWNNREMAGPGGGLLTQPVLPIFDGRHAIVFA